MSGHLRSCFAAFLLAGLSISPAFSNPLADLFGLSPREATAPAPAQEACLLQPGKLTADGQRWVYHSEGHRKCWFQTAEAVASMKKPVNRLAVQQHVTARERREAAFRKRRADRDARAEVLRSAPAEMSQPTPSPPELKVADAAPVPAMGGSVLVPPAPVAESAAQITPDRPTPSLDVETLRVSPSANDTIATSVLPAIPIAFLLAEPGDDGRGWTATRLGVLLMALGIVFLLSSSLPMLVGLFSRSGNYLRSFGWRRGVSSDREKVNVAASVARVGHRSLR